VSARKAEFWWASIHGADPEPVEKTEHDGRPCVFTIGCADAFYLDENPCPVLFVDHEAMPRPEHPDKKEAERAAKYAGRRSYMWQGKRVRLPPIQHGWRGPR
jgi:hypothetical protein